MKKDNFFYFKPQPSKLLMTLLMWLSLLTNAVQAQNPQPYVVYDPTDGVLTFMYGKTKPSGAYSLYPDDRVPIWVGESSRDVKKVVFDASFANARPTSCFWWFAQMNNLTDIEGIENLNTEDVTLMGNMFYNCTSLKSLNLSSFNTGKVTDMDCMFWGCSSLTSLNLSNFNTEKVTDMSDMFGNCMNLTSLDVSNFNTSNVTDMKSMFSCCSSLTSLDLSSFTNQNVKDMSYMFMNCGELESINMQNFGSENVTDMSFMFKNCSSLTSLDLSKFNTENVTNMAAMFSCCMDLRSIENSDFNTTNVKDMYKMFHNCGNLTSIDTQNWNTENVTDMNSMFAYCGSLTSIDISNFNTSKVKDMTEMFYFCKSLTTIYTSEKFATTAIENGDGMFSNCYNLKGAIEYDSYKTSYRYANYIDGYFTYKTPSAIEYLKQDNGNTVNFDLMGRKTRKLSKGINIIRHGNKSIKVMATQNPH